MIAEAHNLRAEPAFGDLARAIAEHARGRPIVFVPNHGNWGDALIAEGARQFFRVFGLAVHEIAFKAMSRRPALRARLAAWGRPPLILFGGGGALTGAYPRHLEKVLAMLRAGERSLVMPSTFGANASIFGQVPNLIAFRRDAFESREHLPSARFCHDMALFLSPPHVEPSRRRGFFLREDRERPANVPPVPGSRDISAEGTHESPVSDFFRLVGEAEEIWTDRLHVAIAGALLGREVHFLPNNYFKNRAVFLSSLEPHFPNVSFHDRGDLP